VNKTEIAITDLKKKNLRMIKIFYCLIFAVAIFTLTQNAGLGLFALALFIIPIFILHAGIGLSIPKLKDHKTGLIVSSVNLLFFVLMRPDGAHAFTQTGLSSILEYFGVHIGPTRKYENELFFGSIALLLLQVVLDLRLRKIALKS